METTKISGQNVLCTESSVVTIVLQFAIAVDVCATVWQTLCKGLRWKVGGGGGGGGRERGGGERERERERERETLIIQVL